MKNIIFKIGCLSLLAVSVACSDFLEEKPKNSMTTNQYFTSPDHARSVVNALYRRGVPEFNNASSAYAGPNMMLGGYLSGLFDNEYKGQEVVVQYSQALTISPQNIAGSLDAIWDACYTAIARANIAIMYIPEIPGLDNAEKTSLIAQAKFFRAYNYFHLVKFFGDVPLSTEPYESLEDLYLPRTSTAEVYTQIENDLKDAIPGLNDAFFTQNNFRITKATAETLLANVYLQMSGYPLSQNNRYADAAAMAKSVINGNKHALIQNGDTPEESAYNKIRTIEESNEYIYSYEYESSISDAGWRPTYAFPNAAAAWGVFKYAITNNVYGATDVILNAYDPSNDLRIQEKQFFFKTYTYTKNGEEIDATLTQTCNWFFYDEEALLNTGKGAKDVTVYRYAEVLLIAAEAIARSGNVVTDEAIGYLADVRERAYTTKTRSEIVNSLKGLSVDDFVKEVWAERLREFPLECKVWDDIQRTRMYPVTSASQKGTINFVNVVGATNPWGNKFQEKHLLWPISANEIQRNPSLTQNSGY